MNALPITQYDDSSIKTDRVTSACRALHEYLHIKKMRKLKVLTSRHYAAGKKTTAYREYYAEVDSHCIEGLFIDWDPDEEELYIGFCLISAEVHGHYCSIYNRSARQEELQAFSLELTR
jgi:hypothetical protein